MKTLDVASLAAVFLERLCSRCCLPGVCFLEPFLFFFFSTDLFTPDKQRLPVRQATGCQLRAAKASDWGQLGRSPAALHPAAGPRRRPAAGAAARGRPMLCWRPLVGPPRTACSTIAESSPPRPLRGWLAGLAGLSLAPAGGRSCVPPRSTDRVPLSRGGRAFAALHAQAKKNHPTSRPGSNDNKNNATVWHKRAPN